MNVQDTVSDYLCREVLFDDKSKMPGPDDPLVSPGGLIDSIGLHQLITFLESQFGFEVDDLDLIPENFETFAALTSYVEHKLQGR